MDKKYQIRLQATKDVQDFVSAAERCDFDVDVFYNRVIIDAKSILGVLSLDLTRVLTVRYGGQNTEFEKVLAKYATA
ncbi:HPr family phosphocarrier protein [Konateibacter massiliensis]|uniref:HPr family phosphocarrier protein n=1 Tax=Konateibacter massiliensis TaxID=2002841 RepID=UPI000C151DE6|nr:HPr family phosphocarrier protein [Konateibacter massiliensis]